MQGPAQLQDASSGAWLSRVHFRLKKLPLFQHPTLLLPLSVNAACIAGNGLFSILIEPHLSADAGATQVQVATAYFVYGIVYSVASCVVGWVVFLNIIFF